MLASSKVEATPWNHFQFVQGASKLGHGQGLWVMGA